MKNKLLNLTAAFLLGGTPVLFGQIDVKFYHLNLEVGLDKASIKGSTLCRFVATSPNVLSFSLDLASEFKVSNVEGARNFEQKDGKLNINLATPLAQNASTSITIFYSGEAPTKEINKIPKGLLYRTHGEDKHTIITTATYPNQAHLWFPCNGAFGDKADSLYVDITIEERRSKFVDKQGKESAVPFIAVSNGVLENTVKDDKNKKRTFQWRHRYPIAPDRVLLAISNFAKSSSDFRYVPPHNPNLSVKFPINFYVLPEELEEAQAMMNRVPEIMTCLSNTFGNYPYHKESFSIIDVDMDFGMDGLPMQTAVCLQDMQSFHIYKAVRNLGRMWYGCWLTPETSKDFWITESLALYAEGAWNEYKRGISVYQGILDQKEYMEGGKLYWQNPQDFSEDRVEKKGMYTIHMLRGIMGEVYFFDMLKGLTEGKKPLNKTTITTKDFQKACEYFAGENTAQDYTYFFDQWVYGEFFPTYKVSYEVGKKGEFKLHVLQNQLTTTPNIFKMPIRLNVLFDNGGVHNETLKSESADQVFNMNFAGKNVIDVQFDIDNWVFKDLQYVRHIMNTKTPIENYKITTTDGRRELTLSFDSPKKQSVIVELTQLANGVDIKQDKVLATQNFDNIQGNFSKQFKIPLDAKKRGVYILKVIGKSDIYKTILRVKQTEFMFEETKEKQE